MKICYIISTCDKYLDTRVKYQMETFLSDIDKNDIFYLTSKPDIEKRHFGWNCMDDSQNITWKYIHFIKNMKDKFCFLKLKQGLFSLANRRFVFSS